MTQARSVPEEIMAINSLLKGRVDVEAHSSEDGAVINIGLNRLAALAAEAEKIMRQKLGHPGRMNTENAEIPQP